MKLLNTPVSIDLDITNDCNLRCTYCYHFSSAGDTKKDLSTDEWMDFFEELKKCRVFSVSLGGGEPLLRKDFKELIDGVVNNKMRFSIISNGLLINDEIIEYLKYTKRCDGFQISIDGSNPEEHDICRGKGSFDKALTGLRCLVKHEMPTTVRVTIHKHNFKALDRIAELLLDDIGLPSFSTNSAGHMGLCRENKNNVQLTSEEYLEAMFKLLELNKKYDSKISAAAGPLASIRTWKEMEDAKQREKNAFSDCGYLRSCDSIFSKIAILADGTIVPCSQLSHIKLGTINKDSLQDIWLNHSELRRLRERRNIPLTPISTRVKPPKSTLKIFLGSPLNF